MAAYAALTSVMYILQQIQQHPRLPITVETQQMDSLCENVSFLQDFLEKHSHRDVGDGKEALESQIANAAYAAEDVIESHIVHQILAKSNFHEENNFIHLFSRGLKKMIRTLAGSPSHKTNQILTGDRERSSSSIFCQDLQEVIEDMNLIKKEVMKIQEKIRGINDDQLPTNIIPMSANIIGSSIVPRPKRKNTNTNTNTMVGFDDALIEIMDRLTGYPTNRQVLPIVGMGGIGKTTLARNVYDNPTIAQHFHIRIWATISQEYRLRDILLQALSYGQNDEKTSSEDALGHQLYQSLCGNKYLIVLDDMWSIEAWENLMLFFPDNKNGSRIIVTTRLSNVADHFGHNWFKMNFLDEYNSWNLLCKITFPQDQGCPEELEEIGKKIAKNCKGLPLSIAVIGGILANSGNTREDWEYVAKNLNSVVNLDDNEHCLNILYLSYNHLPIHLKPCFLYMGVFPEDRDISVPLLKKIWVAEGFLKPIAAKCLEEVAEEYLKDLIDRNLILVHELGSSGKIKYCKIHDLLRDLCLREGQKDKFLWVRTDNDLDNFEGIQSGRRISIHEGASKKKYHIGRVFKAMPSALLTRSLICYVKGVRVSSHSFRLVRVYNNMVSIYGYLVGEKRYRYSLEDIFKLVNSRYLEFVTEWKSTSIFPSSIHLLWNLQTLIIHGCELCDIIHVPPEIWEMYQLRHLEIIESHFTLPDPPNVPLIHKGDDDDFILRNLHTLKSVRDFKLSEEVIKRIPNIKKLEVSYTASHEGWWHDYCLNNLGILNKLESLYIKWSQFPTPSSRIELLQNIAFPHSLQKLTLFETQLLWEDMRMIGSLPHLQVLILRRNSFCGPEWNPVEGEFLCLKFLKIQWCDDLVYWNANSTHFPCLEKLALDYLINLKEIPLEIGQISTLQFIRLSDCMDSVAVSAKNLQDEQVELGNEGLHVQAVFHLNDTQVESLASHNFQVESTRKRLASHQHM